MTTVSTEFLSHTLPFQTNLKHAWHPNPTNTVITCSNRRLNNKGHTKVTSSDTRPHQHYDFRDTNHIKSLNRLCKTGKCTEALYFLEQMVMNGYKPDVILCTKLIKCLFTSKRTEKAVRVMEILEQYGEDLKKKNKINRGKIIYINNSVKRLYIDNIK